MHGVWRSVGDALLALWKPPLIVDEDRLARRDVAHQLEAHACRAPRYSEASIHSVPRAVMRRPSTSGRMPCGSRKPTMPWPMISATTA